MTYAKVKEFYSATPFLPFTIHVADGRSVLVEHPECMAFDPQRRTVVVEATDRRQTIDLLMITSISESKTAGSDADTGQA